MHKKLALWGLVVATALLLGNSGRAEAADWMFQPSYYSNVDSPGNVAGIAPASRSAYRVPFVGAHPKFNIRGGYRFNNFMLQNGNSVDQTFIRESWFDVNY